MKYTLENRIKSALENYEAEFDPESWYALEKKLDGKSGSSHLFKKIALSLLAVTLIGTTAWYFVSHEKENNPIRERSVKNKLSSQELTIENQVFPDEKPIEEKDNQGSHPGSRDIASGPVQQKEIKDAGLIVADPASNEKPVAGKRMDEPLSPEKEPAAETQRASSGTGTTPSADFSSDKITVCANSEINFHPENTDVSSAYYWDFGDGETSTETHPKHCYKMPGVYTVKFQVTAISNRKSDSRIIRDMITVHPLPAMDFSWKRDDNQQINFEFDNEEITESRWEFGDKQYSTDQKPVHLFNKKGNYSVTLALKNAYGCTASCRKIVNIPNDFDLLAPNAFSPNGDGKNDTWLPVALQNGDYIFSLTVLDKNGMVAYKTSSPNNPWDGRHAKTNEIVKSGESFKWMAVVKDKNGTESSFGGVISVTESSGNY